MNFNISNACYYRLIYLRDGFIFKPFFKILFVNIHQMLPIAGAVAHPARAVRALAPPRATHRAVGARVAVPHGAPAGAHVRPALPRHAHRSVHEHPVC